MLGKGCKRRRHRLHVSVRKRDVAFAVVPPGQALQRPKPRRIFKWPFWVGVGPKKCIKLPLGHLIEHSSFRKDDLLGRPVDGRRFEKKNWIIIRQKY